MSNTVIQIEHLSKYYRLGLINHGALFRDIQTWIALKQGKPDPHSRIGENKYSETVGGFWALENLNFEIKQGDRVGIIGKNGAGKSTLLKILSRITAPTEGKVKIRGRVASLLEVGTGFHGELTGRENIYLNGAILGMKKQEVTRKIDEIIDFSGIEQHIDTPVKRYSSGMYVRLAFAVAAHLDSEILIADEVLAVGDVEFQKKALGKMNELSTGEGRTVIFVSHNMGTVKNLCNQGIVLEKGKIKCRNNSIDELINYYYTGEVKKISKPMAWINRDTFYDLNFTPQKIEIIDINNNVVTRPIFYTETFKIRLIFDIDEFDKLFDFGIYIFLSAEKIFECTVHDLSVLKSLKGKNNCFDFTIPANVLIPDKTYTVSLAASIKKTKWIVDPYSFMITATFPVQKLDTNIIKYTKIV